MTGRTGRRGLVALLALAGLAAACTPVTPPAPPPTATTGCNAVPGSTIPGQYVATVDPDGAAPPEVEVFQAATPAEKADEVAQLDQTGTVLAVEPDRVVAALDAPPDTSNDPLFAQQSTMLTEAGFPGAWTAGFAGNGQTVAVLDSGVNASHEDLVGRVVPGNDFVTNSAGGAGASNFGQIDTFGHGTHVAGIVAAADNTKGGIGGAPLATILPVRVLNSCGTGDMSDVIAGITWAAQNNADVINLSLGGSGSACSTGLQNAVNTATGLGVTVVAAAGNSNSSTPIFPAGCSNVLAVGATQGTGATATRALSFSNYGSYVDIAAPGVSIPSTFVPDANAYKNLSGTSMATPYVSAAAALVYQHCTNPTSATVQQILVGSEGPLVVSGLPHALRLYAGAGTFTLTFGGQTTAPIAFDAPAATVDAALEALSTIGAGNVSVSGGPSAVAPYAVTFTGTLATNDPLVPDPAGLSGGVISVSTPVMQGPARVQTATIAASNGTFTLTFAGSETTAPIAFNASAPTVQAALEALPSIGAGNVSVSLGSSGGLPRYSISFLNALAANPSSAVTADATSLTPLTQYAQAAPFPGRLNATAAVQAAC